ncbi:MAG: carboxypeptidase regulatory-like domain-containing protein [Bacteroidetes bacterium]|nr:carboxypeptidase regulatory-like domain-containing protein [Bacteroidota bacterium]MBU1718717.1 carboxypeptidase regulatory-like domain-containing protein [Bacteroidota bacterium]
MKTIYIILALLFSYNGVFSQINLTGDDMPKSGTAYIVDYTEAPTISLGTPGSAPQNWDFTGLVSNYPKFAIYSPTAPYQAYAGTFPTSNEYTYGPAIMFAGLIGGQLTDPSAWGYMFWQSDSTGMRSVGFRADYGIGDTNITIMNAGELLMGAPASYDSVFTNNCRYVLNTRTSPVDSIYIHNISKTLTVDAFGSLTTPYGTYDVLRVHEFLVQVDTVMAKYNGVPVYSMEFSRDTSNNYYFWTNGPGYPLAIVFTDNNSNILRAEILADSLPSYSITGTVYTASNSTNPMNNGEVSLYARDAWDHYFGVNETIPVDANGHFQFANVLGGNWLVWADPDITSYPYNLPTYYGDTIYWEDATLLAPASDTAIVITCSNDSAFINSMGSGIISGTIFQDDDAFSKSNLSGAENVKVTLKENPGGAAIIHTETDANGDFSFSNVENGTYTVRVEIPGLAMDSTWMVTIDNSTPTYTNADYYYDTVLVYIIDQTGVSENNTTSETVSFYPNPFQGNATVAVDGTNGTFEYYWAFCDMAGRIVREDSGTSAGKISLSNINLDAGSYVFTLSVNGSRLKTRKVIIR